MTRRDGHGRYAEVPVTLPLLFRPSPTRRSVAVAKGNRTRRINEMRQAREAMLAAPDYPTRAGASPASSQGE